MRERKVVRLGRVYRSSHYPFCCFRRLPREIYKVWTIYTSKTTKQLLLVWPLLLSGKRIRAKVPAIYTIARSAMSVCPFELSSFLRSDPHRYLRHQSEGEERSQLCAIDFLPTLYTWSTFPRLRIETERFPWYTSSRERRSGRKRSNRISGPFRLRGSIWSGG